MKRGFSLLELMVVAALIMGLAAIGLMMSGGQKASASTRSAAVSLAEELRAARKRAISQGMPVAVAFPTQNGAMALAEGYYILEGDMNPRIRRVARVTSDGSVGFFTGTWATSEAVSQAMPAGGTTFSFDAWSAPNPTDGLLVFLPTGRVVANGLVRHANNYHVVATAGADTGAGTPAPASPGLTSPAAAFSMTRASSPNTVVVSPSGTIRVIEGLPGAGSAMLASGRIAGPVAAVPTVTPPATAQPVLTKVMVEPKPTGGVEALATQDRTLSLRAEAQSPQGALLYCRWTCPEGGVFGSPEAQRMVWDPAAAAYTCTWSYRPVGLAKDAPFQLQCEVVDEFGNVAVEGTAGVATVTGKVGDPLDELIVARKSNGRLSLWRVTSDQSLWVKVLDENQISQTVTDFDTVLISSEGDRMIVEVETSGPDQLWVVNMDGSGLRLLVSGLGSGSPRPYALSPDGTAVAAVTTTNGLVVQPLNGPLTVVKPGLTAGSMAWSPDSKKLFAVPSMSASALIWDRTTSTSTPVNAGAGMMFSQALWPNANKVLFVALGGGILLQQLDVPTSGVSTLVNLGNGLTDAINLSRDNSQVCCSVMGPPGPVMQAGDRLLLQPVAGGAGTFLNPTPIVGNGFYSKDGQRLYSVAWATPSSSVWEVQQCNIDGSNASIILSNATLLGVR